MIRNKFIEFIARIAVKDWLERRIVVPSVVIAQAMKESALGTSELATEANALFGIKLNGWTGDVYIKQATEQRKDGSYYTVDATEWRKYNSWEESVVDHNTYIAERKIGNQSEPNFKNVIGESNYILAVQYLQDAQFPYATSKTYAESLINDYIEKYDLTKYDTMKEVPVMSEKVFLSAGHGGTDPGAVAYGMKEKDINLNILLSCKSELERHGVKVVTSRTTDENDPVNDEVKEANASGADIAVSFHINAGGGDGSESFYYPGSAEGVRLAKLCEKHTKAIGQNSRGVKSGKNLRFVNATTIPAVLCECAFIDNDIDNNIIDTVAEQKALGVAYAKAILEYFGISYKKPESDTIYRVQVGAFRNKANAERLRNELNAKGYNAIIVQAR